MNHFAKNLLLFSFVMLLNFMFFPGDADGQISSDTGGNELTRVKINVSRKIIDSQSADTVKTLSISEVSLLEAGDILIVRFCEKCPGRRLTDLGYQKLLIFFINPASVEKDLKDESSRDVLTDSPNLSNKKQTAKSIAEIKFDGDLKSKKNLSKIYGEHQFIVPYQSIPLIFLVSKGDYRNELRKTILENREDFLKLSAQSNLISQLPQAVNFLLEVKSVIQTPAIYNTEITRSLVQRAQIFRFNQTDCFRQTYLYKTDQERLGCLVKNVNTDELTNVIRDFDSSRIGKITGAEAVARLRAHNAGLNIFFDAVSLAIEIIDKIFRKKPINIQSATLYSLNDNKSAVSAGSAQTSGPSLPNLQPGANNRKVISKTSSEEGFFSLRQIVSNVPSNTEKALIIAPLKWKEKEEIIQADDLKTVEAFPACQCLRQGKNMFWLDTENALVTGELKFASIILQKKTDSSQTLAFDNLPINPTDQSLTLTLDETDWKKIGDWQTATVKIILSRAFAKAEKEINLNIPKKTNWQILRNWNDPLKKGSQAVLRLTSNAGRRECLDKIVLIDEKKQTIQLSPLGEYEPERGGTVKLYLSAKLLDKLQPGKIIVEVYENNDNTPTGKMNFTLSGN